MSRQKKIMICLFIKKYIYIKYTLRKKVDSTSRMQFDWIYESHVDT